MTSVTSHSSRPSFPSEGTPVAKLAEHTVCKLASLPKHGAIFSDAISCKIHETLKAKPVEFDTHLNERIFAHVVGNGIVHNELEGNVFSDSMCYAIDELERLSEGHYGIDLPQEEKHDIEQMQSELVRCEERMHKLYSIASYSEPEAKKSACDQMSHHLLKEAAALAPGERLLLPGGWSSSVQGHAMLYELEKTSDGRILFHLFNTGDGLQYHLQRTEGNDTKFLCHRTWDLGKASNLNINFEGVFSKILQERVGVKREESASNVDDLYQNILPLLSTQGGREMAATSSDPCWMSEQKSAICTWQCIMTWKKSHMRPQTYKRAKLCAKIRAFRQFALQYPETLAKDHKIREFAQQALAKTGRQLAEAGLDASLIHLENIEASTEHVSLLVKSKTTTIASTDHPFSKFMEFFFHHEVRPLEAQSSTRKAKPNDMGHIPWLERLWKQLLKLIESQGKTLSRERVQDLGSLNPAQKKRLEASEKADQARDSTSFKEPKR
jgi:hypothetical protein